MKKDGRKLLRLNDISVNIKLLSTFLCFVFIPLIALNIFSFSKISESVETERRTELNRALHDAAAGISDLFEDAINMSNTFTMDRIFIKYLQATDRTPAEYYAAFLTHLSPRLSPYVQMIDQYSVIRIYADNDSILNGSGFYNLHEQRRRELANGDVDWYMPYRESGQSVFVYHYPAANASSGNGAPVIGMVCQLGIGNTRRMESLLRVELSPDSLRTLLQGDGQAVEFVLTDEQGELLYGRQDYAAQTAARHASAALASSVDVPINANLPPWKLTGFAELSHMQATTDSIRTWLTVIAVISISVSLVFYQIMHSSYNKRISKLLDHMSLIEHHRFDTIEETNIGSDEIGQLMRRFNKMTHEINRLVNDVHMLQMQKKDMEIESIKAEMLNMRSQMDPHFIYNTLSAMMVVSIKEDYPKLVDIIYYLSRLLRRMADRTEDDVSVNEELVFTEMYLKIEKFRFQNQFDYVIRVEDEANLKVIPKFIIQPLVENSFKHGIRPKHGLGLVDVDVRLKNEKLLITVTDNGVGFKAEQLEELLRSMESAEQIGASIGLRNIYRRLKFEYGDDCCMRIHSVSEEGTRIEIEIAAARLRQIPSENLIKLEPGGGVFK